MLTEVVLGLDKRVVTVYNLLHLLLTISQHLTTTGATVLRGLCPIISIGRATGEIYRTLTLNYRNIHSADTEV